MYDYRYDIYRYHLRPDRDLRDFYLDYYRFLVNSQVSNINQNMINFGTQTNVNQTAIVNQIASMNNRKRYRR